MSTIQSRTKTYAGIDHEEHNGMTMTGRIIRDAWVFGLLPEGEGFAGNTRAICKTCLKRCTPRGIRMASCPAAYPPSWPRATRASTTRPCNGPKPWAGMPSWATTTERISGAGARACVRRIASLIGSRRSPA